MNLLINIHKLLAKSTFLFGDYIKNTGMFSAMKKIISLRYASSSDIQSAQLLYLQQILSHAYNSTKFYKGFYDQHSADISQIRKLSDMQKLPIVKKEHIKKHYVDMISNVKPISAYTHFTSSGSTGNPKNFYTDKFSYGWRMACFFIGWERAGFQFGDSWLRLSLYPRSGVLNKVIDWLTRCTYVDLFCVDDEKLKQLEYVLDTKAPEMIYAYSSSAYILAKYLNDRKKKYTCVKSFVTQGDMLFPHYRKLIESVFNVVVTDTYGGDGTSISGQCKFGNYHIFDPAVIIEIVDDKGKVVPAGKVGHVLVTDLHNFPMPLIRYDVGDLATLLNVKCPCGESFSIMSQPHGRDTDIITFSNGVSLIVHTFTAIFSKYNEVEQFQVIQTDVDTLKLNLVVTKGYTSKTFKAVKKELLAHTHGVGKIIENVVKEIPLERSNKRRFVIAKNK